MFLKVSPDVVWGKKEMKKKVEILFYKEFFMVKMIVVYYFP